MNSFRGVAVAFVACLLAACGGGGSGGSTGGGTPTPPRGAFTLSGNSASFSVAQQGTAATAQQFNLSVTGRDVAYVGAAYTAGQTPAPWLNINILGSGTSYVLEVGVVNILPAGQYMATFSVGTADAAGTVLQQQNFTVNLTVYEHVSIVNLASIVQEKLFVYGDAVRTHPFSVDVRGPARPWSLSSTVPWIQVPPAALTGNALATATLNLAGLAPGNYEGVIYARDNADAVNAAGVSVYVRITEPTFTTTQQSLLFGGENGDQALIPLPVNFKLTTGAGVHPYTAAVTTDSDGAWLQVTNPMGTVGDAGAAVNLSIVPGSLRGATRTAQLSLSTDVYGRPYTVSVPVTWNHEWNRLVTSAAGVGFSSLPGRSVLTRTLKVFASAIHAGTPWTAESDQPWLSVTASGVTDGNLVLTANPAGLAAETTHFANVTVRSSDPLVENIQTVRVGLYVSNNPPLIMNVARVSSHLAASPVEPLIAVAGGPGVDVHLYNVYSGALVRTLTNVAAQPAAIEFSGDGSKLFVFDRINLNVRAVNAVTGAQLASYDATSIDDYYRGGLAVDVLRPGGAELVITPGGRIYDSADGHYHANAPYFGAVLARALDHSPNQGLVSPDFGSISSFRRTALRGGGIEIQYVGDADSGEGYEGCFNAAGTRFYGPYNDGNPHSIGATSLASGQIVQQLPAGLWPSSVKCVWNELVIGGTEYTNYSTPAGDIFVYNGISGVSRANLNAAVTGQYGVHPIRRGLEVSADGTRIIAIYGGSVAVGDGEGISLQSLPTPE